MIVESIDPTDLSAMDSTRSEGAWSARTKRFSATCHQRDSVVVGVVGVGVTVHVEICHVA